MKYINIEKLPSIWARQLHREFEDICWKYNISLNPPVIEINKSEKQLGSWDASKRTIKISSFLIANYSWDITINVLKHEMAHQMCSEIFKVNDYPHGDGFKKACQLIGLALDYSKAKCNLSADSCIRMRPNPSEKGIKLINKVEKLLALAESANEHEASLAMQKANELMAKYNLNQLSHYNDYSFSYVIIDKKKKRIETYQRKICTILRDFFHVKIVNSYLYDPFSDSTFKTIELIGTHENVLIAEYCYYFLEKKLATLWQLNKHNYSGKGITKRNSYYLGILNGFYEKLKKQTPGTMQINPELAKSSKEEILSLVEIRDKEIDNFIAFRFPRLRKFSRSGAKIYKSIFDDGVEVGKNLNLHKGVNGQDGYLGNLIGEA